MFFLTICTIMAQDNTSFNDMTSAIVARNKQFM